MLMKWTVETESNGICNTYTGDAEIKAGKNHITCSVPACILKSVTATIKLTVREEEKIFMNGFQTWTDCPERTIKDKIKGMHGIPGSLIKKYGFDRSGDYLFTEYPNKKGITHGESWCYFRYQEYYRLFASLNEVPGYTQFQYDAYQGILTINRDCEGLKHTGEYPLFDLYYAEGDEQEVFDQWINALHIQKPIQDKLYGYSSWYNRYQDINEKTIIEDLQGCKNIFEEGDLFQIDDGWEPFVGDWLEADNDKFPSGMKEMASMIHDEGYRAGLWLAPFTAETESKLYQEHQDWFLKVNGENWFCGSNWSGYYSLDFDKQEVKDYVRKVMDRVLNEWGFDLVKLDFLFAIAPFGNASETRAARMIRAMHFIREVCGDKLILGCGVPVMPAFGCVDYCRIGCDVSLDWNDVLYMRMMHRERVSTKNAIGNIVSRRELNNRVYGNDPDVFFLRTENIKLNEDQKDSLMTLDALLGNVFLISDDPGKYTEEMKEKYRNARYLSHAKVLHVNNDNGITIDYELDGKKETVHLF